MCVLLQLFLLDTNRKMFTVLLVTSECHAVCTCTASVSPSRQCFLVSGGVLATFTLVIWSRCEVCVTVASLRYNISLVSCVCFRRRCLAIGSARILLMLPIVSWQCRSFCVLNNLPDKLIWRVSCGRLHVFPSLSLFRNCHCGAVKWGPAVKPRANSLLLNWIGNAGKEKLTICQNYGHLVLVWSVCCYTAGFWYHIFLSLLQLLWFIETF